MATHANSVNGYACEQRHSSSVTDGQAFEQRSSSSVRDGVAERVRYYWPIRSRKVATRVRTSVRQYPALHRFKLRVHVGGAAVGQQQ